MKVYIEYVLIDNFIIDFLLLKATFLILGIPVKKRRLFLCAILGSIIALLFPLMNFNLILTSIIKVFSGLLIVSLATKYATFKQYYKSFLCFLFFTFALGGAIIGVFSMLNLDYSSEISIALMILPAYLIIKIYIEIIKYFFNRTFEQKFTADCALYCGERRLEIKGFFDTGNSLTFCDKQVIVIDRKNLFKIVGEKELLQNKKYIEYQTSAGKSKMPIFSLDKIDIKLGETKYSYFDIYLAMGITGEKGLILHPSLMGGNYENIKSIKKAT